MTEKTRQFVDTNVLVRYFTDDLPKQAAIAESILEGNDLLVDSVILLETSYVLTRLYSYPREEVVDVLVEFLQRKNVAVVDLPKETVAVALLSVRDSSAVSFGDALIVASMRAAGVREIYSFDRSLKAEGITVLAQPDQGI